MNEVICTANSHKVQTSGYFLPKILFQFELNQSLAFCWGFFLAMRLLVTWYRRPSWADMNCLASSQRAASFSGLFSSMPISSERSVWSRKYTEGSYTSFRIVWTAKIKRRVCYTEIEDYMYYLRLTWCYGLAESWQSYECPYIQLLWGHFIWNSLSCETAGKKNL